LSVIARKAKQPLFPSPARQRTMPVLFLQAYNVVMRTAHVAGDDYPHRGVTMHEMPVGANVPGIVFAIGSVLIFLLAIPALWYVIVAAAIVGLLISAFLQFFYRNGPDETERLTFKL